jgi:hypothetical protein
MPLLDGNVVLFLSETPPSQAKQHTNCRNYRVEQASRARYVTRFADLVNLKRHSYNIEKGRGIDWPSLPAFWEV